MEPTYYTGDVVWAQCGEPKIGDVVVYEPDGTDGARVIHRITGGTPEGWTIQGDNNDLADPWTPDESDVIGIVRAHVPWVGGAILGFGNPFVWVSLLLLAAGLLLWPQSGRPLKEPETADVDAGEKARQQSDGDRSATGAPDKRRDRDLTAVR